MKVKVRLYQTSQPIELEAKNTYQKGSFYCVYLETGVVKKYPLQHIFEIEESY